MLAYYSALKNPLISFDFPGTKLYIALGVRSIDSVVCLCFFFSPTLILLAVQLRDGRFCTAALNSRLPSRGCFSLSLTVLTVFIRKHIDPTLLGLITFEKSTNSLITLSKRLRHAMQDDQSMSKLVTILSLSST